MVAHRPDIPRAIRLEPYRVGDAGDVLTPALAIYPEMIDANIAVTLDLLGGHADRWRPHVKTSKLAFTLRRLLRLGVDHFKCATTRELAVTCEAGAADVLVAYPAVGANARRIRTLAERFGDVRVSALVETSDQLAAWSGGGVGIFVDINPGMKRTGIEQERVEEIVELAIAVVREGLTFRGLHYYDGHLTEPDRSEREARAHRGYDRLMETVASLASAGVEVEEVVTSGTPSFPCALSYDGFDQASFRHRVSPGTVIYGDCTSLEQLPPEYGFRPAALVLSTVVSHPEAGRLTCDAGHKTVSADAGVPTCAVLGRPDLEPGLPSEEHLPMRLGAESARPPIGEILYLLPRHVCPTINSFDHALVVSDGRILGVERVTARGREAPLPGLDTD